MAKFGLIYRGAKPFTSREDGMAHMANWKAWAEGLGKAYIYPGMPFSAAMTVAADGVTEGSGAVALNGVSVIEAESMEAALAIAKSCPHLNTGGDIVVAQGMDMEM